MRALYGLLTLVFSQLTVAEQTTVLEDLDQLVWQHRLIVVWAEDDAQDHQHLLTADDEAIVDRDIIWFILDGDDIISNYEGALSETLGESIKQHYRLQAGQTILIGKDGGVKDRSDELRPSALFDQIDLMPMRQQEMQYD